MMFLTALLLSTELYNFNLQQCNTPDALLNTAKTLESTYREPISQAGIPVDRRIDAFREFNKKCIFHHTIQYGNRTESTERQQILNAVEKSFFYSRSQMLLDHYQQHLDQQADYQPGRTFIHTLNEIKNPKERTGEELLLNSDSMFVNFDKSNTVVIVGSPYCQFSVALKAWLESRKGRIDPTLVWITKAPVGVSAQRFFSDKSRGDFLLVSDFEYWTSIKNWATPAIYQFKDRELVSYTEGFSEETKKFFLQLELAKKHE